jgi:hypothetical protein
VAEIIHPFTLQLRNVGRDADDEWEQIEPAHIVFWESEAHLLRTHTYEHDGCSVTVNIDWKPIARRHRQDFALLVPLRIGKPPAPNWSQKLSRPLRLRANARVEGKNKLSEYPWYSGFFVELAVYETFLKSNLALPGVANFYTLTIHGASVRSPLEPRLSGYSFDFWSIESLRGNWPHARRIPLQQVVDWYSALRIGPKQRADSGIERAIFAVYHLCRLDSQIDSILWLFHGIEALLSTRIGENLSGIVRRVSMLLDLNPKQRAHLNKKLRELYDLRSAFVHGGYEVPHPMRSEVVDRRLDDDYAKLVNANHFGFALLCSVLQVLAEKNIIELAFEERLVATTKTP